MRKTAFVVPTQSGYAVLKPPGEIMPLASGRNFQKFPEVVEWLKENGYASYRSLGPVEPVVPLESDTGGI